MTGNPEPPPGLGFVETHRPHRAVQALEKAPEDLERVHASDAGRDLWNTGGCSWPGLLLELGADQVGGLGEQLRAAATGRPLVRPTRVRPPGGVGMMCEVFIHVLPSQTASAGWARAWATDLLRPRVSDTEAIEATLLVISELVTNALRHSGLTFEVAPTTGAVTGVVRLRVFVAARRIRVDVTNPAVALGSSSEKVGEEAVAGSVPVVCRPTADAEHGRGLAITQELCERLFWRRAPEGYTVTAQLTHTPAQNPTPMAIHQEALLLRVP
ncbi:ATP-binding protein [Lipingzhangella sp. LS1_29]|uniref:ATP-binding protein n=1 Tax=Lipingzhangella rawalii TaxID=2055835 RepID=A0ABU2H4U6_9ACTN|nr:ATP-binding protein [Lipingzhangella rawalii]MDS1269840.1 ATP-binding protein [Lipingzhangella rawalii]